MKYFLKNREITIPSILYLIIALILILWIFSFFFSLSNIKFKIVPISIIFIFLGIYKFDVGFLIWIFLLPILPIYPLLNGVSNFSPNEIFLYALITGTCLRRVINNEKINIPFFTNSEKLLFLYALLILFSFLIHLMNNHIIGSKIFLMLLPKIFTGIFQSVDLWELKSYRIFFDFFTGIIIFFCAKTFFNEKNNHQNFIFILLAGGAIASIYGYFQFIFGFNLIDFWEKQGIGTRRINATFPDVNSAGTFFSILIFLALGCLFLEIKKNKFIPAKYYIKEILLFLVLFSFIILIMTGSKTNISFTIILLGLFFLFNKKLLSKITQYLNRYNNYIVIVLFIFFVLWTILLPKITKDFDNSLKFLNSESKINEYMKGRSNLWRSSIFLWADSPIFGNGIGTTVHKISKYYNPNAPYWNPIYENSHNYFLQIGAETGVVGLFIFILLSASFLLKGLNTIFYMNEDKEYFYIKSILFSLIIILFVSIFSHPLLIRELLWLNFIFYAFILKSDINYECWNSFGNDKLKTVIKSKKLFISPLTAIFIIIIFSFPFRIYDTANAREFLSDSYGCHSWEIDETGRGYRWCKRYSKFLINTKFPEVAFHIRNPRGPDMPVKIKIILDGKLKDEILLDDFHWYPVRILYPSKNTFRHLELIADKSWIPKELLNPQNDPNGNQDVREFSFMLSYFNFA